MKFSSGLLMASIVAAFFSSGCDGKIDYCGESRQLRAKINLTREMLVKLKAEYGELMAQGAKPETRVDFSKQCAQLKADMDEVYSILPENGDRLIEKYEYAYYPAFEYLAAKNDQTEVHYWHAAERISLYVLDGFADLKDGYFDYHADFEPSVPVFQWLYSEMADLGRDMSTVCKYAHPGLQVDSALKRIDEVIIPYGQKLYSLSCTEDQKPFAKNRRVKPSIFDGDAMAIKALIDQGSAKPAAKPVSSEVGNRRSI